VGEIGALQRAFNVMGARWSAVADELAALADEQAGLRRVATLVARGASPDDVLAAVASEIGQLLPATYAIVGRYDANGTEFTTVGSWSRERRFGRLCLDVGRRADGTSLPSSGRPRRPGPHRSDEPASGPVAPYHRALGVRSTVGVPINFERAPLGHRRRRVHPRGTDAGRHGSPARQLHRARLNRHRECRRRKQR
jgi:hypothetical protein